MPNEKNMSYIIPACLAILVALFVFCGDVLHDKRSGSNDNGSQLEQIEQVEQKQSERIEELQNATDRIADREREAGELIAECQAICSRIRANASQESPE